MARVVPVLLLFLLATMAVAATPEGPKDPKPPGEKNGPKDPKPPKGPEDPKPPKGPKDPKDPPPPPPPPTVQTPPPAFPPTLTPAPAPAPGPSMDSPPPPPPTVEPPTAQPPPPPHTVEPPTSQPPPPPTVEPPTLQPPPVAPPPSPKTVKCRNKKYPTCVDIQMACPAACINTCSVDCETCSPVCQCNKPGGVCEDPRFVGGDGIAFYFHGRRDRNFCLLSDTDLHINAHFIGRRNPNMNRDFTWVQSIAVLFHNNHRLYIAAMRTSTWDDAVDRISIAFDGEPISLPAEDDAHWRSSVDAPSITIVRSSETNAVIVEVDGMFRISAAVVPITEEDSRVHRYGVTSDDCFAHLELGFKFYSLTRDVHGVLGQTYREDYVSRVKVSAAMPIMGGEHRFSTSDLYAADCKVARFGHGGGGGIAMVMEEQQKDLMCSSGIGGRGIVCKK